MSKSNEALVLEILIRAMRAIMLELEQELKMEEPNSEPVSDPEPKSAPEKELEPSSEEERILELLCSRIRSSRLSGISVKSAKSRSQSTEKIKVALANLRSLRTDKNAKRTFGVETWGPISQAIVMMEALLKQLKPGSTITAIHGPVNSINTQLKRAEAAIKKGGSL